ncbi:MAG TPA: carboxypeptidase-like regulatory domain-containing protein, partial [Pyrinomonadaceae bacterium]|nr:carboxypeptidase-like regulatory domain-containing protein [Pyrinomonadaceae bacterium]
LGQSQAHYLEGESVPYRLRFSNLSAGASYTVTIEYDTTENSGAKHALDCLTSFDRTETTADPCSGVAGCNLTDKYNFAIPPDANFTAGFDGINGTFDDIPAMPGDFTLFNGQITAVSSYTITGTYSGASQTKITITFTANATNPVLAWGGHISTRVNWGTNNSAIAISGSPYHMRLIDLNGTGGNQDRSLSSAATIFPGKIAIIKDARPNTGQIFGFTTNGPGVSNFSLVDDGTNSGNSQLFENLTNFGATNSVTVTENLPVNFYSLTQINCVEDASGGGGQQNTTVSLPSRFANIILEEGESVTCTFVNAVPTAATAVLSGRVFDIYGGAVRDVIVSVSGTNGEVLSTRTNNFGFYRFTELPVGESYAISVSSRRYTFATDSRIVMLMDDLSDQDFTAIPIDW